MAGAELARMAVMRERHSILLASVLALYIILIIYLADNTYVYILPGKEGPTIIHRRLREKSSCGVPAALSYLIFSS